MAFPKNPMKGTLELLVDVLKYMKVCEKEDSQHKTTVNGIIRGIQTIYNSANNCKKVALKLKLIRELRERGKHRQNFYKLTPSGRRFIKIAENEGVYSAWTIANQECNIGLQSEQETPSSN